MMGFNIELAAIVAMVLTLINVEVESSGGLRGELLEKIKKSPRIILHEIEVKTARHSQVSKVTARKPMFQGGNVCLFTLGRVPRSCHGGSRWSCLWTSLAGRGTPCTGELPSPPWTGQWGKPFPVYRTVDPSPAGPETAPGDP